MSIYQINRCCRDVAFLHGICQNNPRRSIFIYFIEKYLVYTEDLKKDKVISTEKPNK